MNQKEIGIEGEHEFIRRLNNKGIPYNYLDSTYDFEIYGEKIDVKTCRLSQKFSDKKSKKQKYKIGRIQLSEEQTKNDLWYAIFLRHKKEFLFMGFYEIKKNKRKYYSIHNLREMKEKSFKEFIKIAKTRQTKRRKLENGKRMVEEKNS